MQNRYKKYTKKHLNYAIFALFLLFFLLNISLCNAEEKNPRLANYFLPWSITDEDVINLAKWDLLILDMENQVNNPEKLQKIRELNPNIKILAYISTQEIRNSCDNDKIRLRCELLSQISEQNYLKDINGNQLSFWPGTHLLNPSSNWNYTLPLFVKNKIYSSKIWDGIFYDNVWGDISWFNNGNIDIDNDNDIDDKSFINSTWKNGMLQLLQNTKNNTNNNFLIVANSVEDGNLNQIINGRMFESFPNQSEENSTWKSYMKLYLTDLPQKNIDPKIYIINSNTRNSGIETDYQKMRYGLTNTLLGNGYFSYDFGDKAHAQTWWYDEYNVNLGESISQAINLKNKNNTIEPGLWRRDYENGISITNSTEKNQIYVFNNEVFEKIKGTQDTKINSGEKINYINLNSQDGIILTRTNQEIKNALYNNGDFVRIFDISGNQAKSGFFAIKNGLFENTKILSRDIDGDEKTEVITSSNGIINIYNKHLEKLSSFYPYDKKYTGGIIFDITDINNDGKLEIITSPVVGGAHIRIFDLSGKLINEFFAYNKNLKGGASVSTGDINNDGKIEIIIGSGNGNKANVLIFDNCGKLINQFLSYDKNFKGGVNIATGDINNDGKIEIITSPKSSGGAHIRIFDSSGKLINQFFAYDKNLRGGFTVSITDIDNDGFQNILVGTNQF